jgi:hypothetical protein
MPLLYGGYTRFALIRQYDFAYFEGCTGGLEAVASYIRPKKIFRIKKTNFHYHAPTLLVLGGLHL